MNINFKEIRISNFLSLGSAKLEFSNNGFVLVEGKNLNPTDKALSNGSGKSSIFEAIVWAMTGQTIRGTKEVVNRYGNDGACVELEFNIDNDTYSITRFRDHSKYGTNLKIIRNGQDISGKGIRDSEKILEEYLPDLNAQLLGSVIVLGQGLPQRFTNNTPAGRKEILEKLSKSDFMIEDVKQRLTQRKGIVSQNLRTIEDNILSYKTKLEMANRSIESSEMSIRNLQGISISETQEKIEQLKINLSRIEKEKSEIVECIEDNESSLEAIKNTKEQELNKLREELKSSLAPITEEIQNIRLEINTKETIVKSKNAELYRLTNVATECPTCKRPYDDVHKPDTTELESIILAENNALIELRSSLNVARDRESSIQEKYRQEEVNINNKYFDIIQEYNNTINKDKIDLSRKQQDISEIQKEIQRYELEVLKVNTELDSHIQIKEASLKDKAEYEEQLTKLDIQHNDVSNRLEAITKLLTLAQRDFRTHLLEDIIKYVNERANKYSARLFDGKHIEFKGDSNQIWIGIDGKAYESLSGGERQKTDLIIQFSLRDMLINTLNFSSNILVLDEVFDNLDEVGSNSLVELIMEDLSDIESVYVITHHADISIPYDSKILICKEVDGISTLR